MERLQIEVFLALTEVFYCGIGEQPFLTPFWNDIGILATFVALVIAIWQIRRTKSAANRAKEAAEGAVRESQRSFQRYAALAARHLLDLIKVHGDNKQWKIVAMRLNDLGKQAGDLAYVGSTVDTEWIEFAAQTRQWATTLGRKEDDSAMANTQVGRWRDYLVNIERKIDSLVRGFQAGLAEDVE